MIKYITDAINETGRVWLDELKKIFSDGGVMLLLFGATIIYPVIYSITYNPEVLDETPIAVIDEDNSKASRQLIRMVDATQTVFVQKSYGSLEEAKQAFYSKEVYGIMLIPEEFSKNILKNEQAHVAVYADVSYMLLYKQVYSGVLYASQTMGKSIEVKRRLMKGVPMDKAIAESNPVMLKSEPLFNPSGGYGSYAMPAILILILQQTLLLGIGMRGGTAREMGAPHYLIPLTSSRTGALRVIFGKMAAYLTLYIPISLYELVLLVRWFKFPQAGDPAQLFVFIIPFLLAAILLGFLLTSFFTKRESSMIVLMFTSVPLIFLSGFSWPVESFPVAMKYLAHVAPSSATINGFLKIGVMGGTIQDAMPQWIELWVMTGVLFVVNWWLVNWRLRKNPR